MRPRMLVMNLPTRTMRTAYCLIAEDALDLCASFLRERSSLARDSISDLRLLVDVLKAGRDSLGLAEPLRVSSRSYGLVGEVVARGRHTEEYNEAAQHLAMEVAIPLAEAFRVVRAIGVVARRERAAEPGGGRHDLRLATDEQRIPLAIAHEDGVGRPANGVRRATALLPQPTLEVPPGSDPRRHLAQELARAHRRAGKPKYKDLQAQLAPLPASPGTLSGVFKGHRAPKWELLVPLLQLLGARQDDIDRHWRHLWLAAQEHGRPIGALPASLAPMPPAHGYECPDCGSWVMDTEKHLQWHLAVTHASPRGRGILLQVEGNRA
ncbi:hypothetical protein ABZ907_04950 [Nonomuraea wenchangensis]